ncbi:MAG TPA: septation protein SpoVG family protein [Ignavibacteriaceae bacterium]|mgnify:CR=1 FL=1|nr:septation protein SpoVG family protein [Ignavibacteriaceae bacterium]
MKIVRMTLLEKNSNSKMVAFLDIETDDGIILKKFRLINGPNGLFLSAPSEKGKDDKYYETVILPKSLKEEAEKAAIEEYNKQKK